MPKSLRLAATCVLLAGAATIAAIPAAAQSSTVVYQGLPHTAVGRATLSLNPERNTLDVQTFDPQGADGVAVKLGDAVSWMARLRATRSDGLPLALSWQVLAEGRAIGSASMRQSGRNFQVAALFTGATTPTYAAQVYSDGRLVGSLGNIPTQAHIIVPESFCETFGSVGFIACDFVSEFHNAVNSQCLWRFAWGRNVAVRLPNGATLTGNELRLVEEVRPAGHYLYPSFDGIVMRGNGTPLTLLAETAR
jgi:hypothetical protein